MKTIIFIDSEKLIKKIKKSEDNVIIIPMNPSIEYFLKDMGIKYKSLNEYQSKKNIRDFFISWIQNWPDVKVLNDKNFKEIFSYGNFSFFWLIDHFFSEGTIYYTTLFEAFQKIDFIDNVIKTEKPDKIKIFSYDHKFRKLFSGVKNTEFQPKNLYNLYFSKDYKKIFYIYSRRFFKLTRLWNSKIFHSQNNDDKKIKIISLSDQKYYTFNKITKKIEYESMDDILRKKLGYKYNLKSIVFNSGSNINLTSKNVQIENYMKLNDYIFALHLKRKYYKLWKELKKNEKFIELFKFKEINFFAYAKETLEFFFSIYIIDMMVDILSYERLFNKEKPHLITTTSVPNEEGDKILFAAAKTKNKVITFQHVAFDLSDCLVYKTKKKDLLPQNAYLKRPTASKYAVSGPLIKENINSMGDFDKNWLEVTGYLKYDIIPYLKKNLNREELCRELGLDSSKKIIIYCTQPLNSITEREMVPELIFSAIKKLNNKDIQVLIKLHPAETKNNINFYKLSAKNNGINAVFIKDYNIFKALFIGDICISVTSNTLIEALLFDKFTIMVDIFNKGYHREFGNSPSIINITSEVQLREILKKLLEDKKYQKRIKQNIDKSVFDFFYKIDGNTAERIVRIIEKMT